MGIARFSEEWIEQVRSAVDIVEVIGRRVELRQSGKNYVGLCPFHSEKTPSFTVEPEKQFYHCFGCGQGGNVFNFIMATENLTFPEAVIRLAEEKGIPVPVISPRERRREQEREQLRQVNLLAARFFYRNLRRPAGAQAWAYLQRRGISGELARSFYLGFAPEEWDGLAAFLQAQGIDLGLAQAAGLVTKGKRGYIDRFRGRLMFPICDHLGRFVGFGGRSIGEGQPKYLNTGQTPVFNKGQILYGLNWAKEEIKAQDQVVIVEGYTDVISLFAVGQRNVVASLGTAFTSAHARLLRRFCSQAIIAFDGDTAGQRAAWRGMEVLHASGLQVRVASLASGQDPDSYARSQGAEAVRTWLNSAQPFREYQIDRIISQHDVETREGKLAASTELVTLLAQLTSAVERDEYLRYAAERLGVREESLAAEVNQKLGIAKVPPVHNRRNLKNIPKRRRPKPPLEAGEALREREVLRYLLQEPDLLAELQQRGVSPEDFQHPEYRQVFVSLSQSIPDAQGTAIASRLLSLPAPTANWEDCLQSFLAVLQRRRLRKIEEKLSLLENDREGFDVRMELYQLIKEYFDIYHEQSF